MNYSISYEFEVHLLRREVILHRRLEKRAFSHYNNEMKRISFILIMIFFITVPGSVRIAYGAKPPANGRSIEYYPGGKKIYRMTWRKEERVVRRKVFSREGTLLRDVIYDENGGRMIDRIYFDNGRLKSLWTARTQELKIFDKTGRLRRTLSTASQGLTVDTMPRSLIFR